MKTLGIIGGIGPESTVDYYRSIIAAYRDRVPDGSNPAFIINSIDMKRMLGMIAGNELAQLIEYLAGEIEKLARAGSDFALMAANTPHIVFDELQRQSSIPLLSIVKATREAASGLGLKKPGLFGTRFTMQGRFYPEAFQPAGITLVAPGPEEQNYIHDKYMSELGNGIFLPETRKGLLAIVEQMKTREGIDGLIMAGTELPLILRDVPDPGIPFLDTTQIHVKAAVAQLLL